MAATMYPNLGDRKLLLAAHIIQGLQVLGVSLEVFVGSVIRATRERHYRYAAFQPFTGIVSRSTPA